MVLVVEHESTRSGRWLRRNRVRLALWIAVAEAALVVFGVIPRWPAFFVGAGLIAFYLFVGRRFSRDTVRQAAWVAAMSQVLIAFLPLLLAVVTIAAFVAIAVVAAVAVAFLFLDRR